MPLTLVREDLPALEQGFAMLGSGGGGSAHLTSLMLNRSASWPILVHAVTEVDLLAPCIAVGYGGATLLLEERLPGDDPFGTSIAAVERWLGVESSVVCTIEGAGVNGLASLHMSGTRQVVDADCMGRALPDLDQISLLIDALPDLVVATPTGAGGVAIVHAARPEDVERVLRPAIECNGGWAGLAIGGFQVGDLVSHAILDGLARALSLGRAMQGAVSLEPAALAEGVNGDLLGVGRIVEARSEPGRPGLTSFDLRTREADVLRLVARSELLALVRNGVTMASTPTVIVALDATTRVVLAVDELAVGKDVIVISLPAAAWWFDDPWRLQRARPQNWGIDGLERSR